MSSYVSATSQTTPTLVFNHLLTNIVLNVSSANLDLSSLEVSLSALTAADVNIFTSSIAASGDKSTILPTANGTNSYKAIIVPQSYSTGELMGAVVIEETVVEFYSPSNLTLASGCQYSLNVVVDELPGGAITVTFTDPIINGWNEGTIEGEIGGDDPVEEWVTVSTNAVWYDDVCMSPFSSSTPVALTGVTVQEHSATPGLFRLVDLYVNDDFTQHVFSVSAEELLGYTNLLEGYSIEINATNPDKVYIPLQNTGFMASETYGYHYIATLNSESAGLDWSTSYSYYGTYDAEAGTISFTDAEGMYTILSSYSTSGGWRTNDDGLTKLYFNGDDYVEPSDEPENVPESYTMTSITSTNGSYWADWYSIGMSLWYWNLTDTGGAYVELEILSTSVEFYEGIPTMTYPYLADGYYTTSGCICDVVDATGITIDGYKHKFSEDSNGLTITNYGGDSYILNFDMVTEYGTAVTGRVVIEMAYITKNNAPAAVLSPSAKTVNSENLRYRTADFYSFEY